MSDICKKLSITLPALVFPLLAQRFLPRKALPGWWASLTAHDWVVPPWWLLGGPAVRTPGPAGPVPPAGPPWAATARARPSTEDGRSWPRLQRRCPAAHGGLQSRQAPRRDETEKKPCVCVSSFSFFQPTRRMRYENKPQSSGRP